MKTASKVAVIFVLILSLAFGMNAVFADQIGLSDIKNHWAQESIERLVDLGLIQGYPDGRFRPQENMTRAETAKLLDNTVFYINEKIDTATPDITIEEIQETIIQTINDRQNQLINTIQQTEQAVVVIQSGNSIGSGVCIAPNTVLTCAHVVDNSLNITVTNSNEQSKQGNLICIDKEKDLALINVKLTMMPLDFVNNVQRGQDVYVYGCPLGFLDKTVTKGIISEPNRVFARKKFIQVDAAINSGNSGGPVCIIKNGEAKIAGISALQFIGGRGIYPGLNLAISVDEIETFLKENGR